MESKVVGKPGFCGLGRQNETFVCPQAPAYGSFVSMHSWSSRNLRGLNMVWLAPQSTRVLCILPVSIKTAPPNPSPRAIWIALQPSSIGMKSSNATRSMPACRQSSSIWRCLLVRCPFLSWPQSDCQSGCTEWKCDSGCRPWSQYHCLKRKLCSCSRPRCDQTWHPYFHLGRSWTLSHCWTSCSWLGCIIRDRSISHTALLPFPTMMKTPRCCTWLLCSLRQEWGNCLK
jgi:hypothetical protein